MAFELEDLFLPPSDDEQTYASLLAASPHPVDVNRRPADLVADGHPADKVVNQLRCSEVNSPRPARTRRRGAGATKSGPTWVMSPPRGPVAELEADR